jgi:hypothetical protein
MSTIWRKEKNQKMTIGGKIIEEKSDNRRNLKK